MDPLAWEAEQLDKLEAWAERTGVDDSDPMYKKRAKLIQMTALAKMRAAAGEAAGRAPAPPLKVKGVTFKKIKSWVLVGSAKAKDKESAKVLLKKVKQEGIWKQDINSPRSHTKGGLVTYRFVNVTAVGGPYLARLVDVQSKNEWRVETPIFEEEDEEEEEEGPPGDGGDDQAAAEKKKEEEAAPLEPAAPAKESRKRLRKQTA